MSGQRFRVDMEVVPVDAGLHRVLAACHRRRVTIDSLEFRRSPAAHRIVMEVLTTSARAELISNVFEGEPVVLRCTTSPVDVPPAPSAG